MTEFIYFKCVKDGSKLRVRAISQGYNSEANCQFPKAIRKVGAIYRVPVADVSFAYSSGKFFYRVKAKNVCVVDEENESVGVEQIFDSGESECLLCMENPNEVVLVSCGHYCMCSECAKKLMDTTRLCPLCRSTIVRVVMRDEL